MRLVAAFLVVVLVSGCATGGGRPLAPAASTDQLRVAKQRYEQHDYAEAVDLLKGYIQFQSGASDLDEAHFLLGMCYVKRQEWPLAATEFSILSTDFQDSPRLPDAQYWLGVSYWRQSKSAPYDQDMTRRAIAQFDRFLSMFPDHPQVAEVKEHRGAARERLAEKAFRNGKLYLKLHYWEPARYYFSLARSDYPETRWAERSLAGEAEALIALNKAEQARALLDANRDTLTDPEAKARAQAITKKLPPTTGGTPSPAPSAGAAG